jgi:diguanylate cyclase (GGDEF)-like protein/PAS domain S-box-containing protein
MFGKDEVGFQFLAELSTDVVCRIGLDMAVRYASPASLLILGWPSAEMAGRRLDSLIAAEDAGAFAAACAANQAIIVRMPKRDGTLAWIEIKQCLLRDVTTGEPTEIVAVLRDVADRKPLHEILSALALTDPLTGLFTHHAFLKALEREWNSAARTGSPISLVRLNFNDFRQFQTGERHGEKENWLRRAAAAVLGVLRVTDLAARYGADDIVIILPFTDVAGAAKVAAKARAAVQLLRATDGIDAQRSIKVSMGIATALARTGGAMRIPELLLSAADHALHKAQHHEAEPPGHSATERSMPSPDWKMSMPDMPPKWA